jgi:signal transduction histidine kinase
MAKASNIGLHCTAPESLPAKVDAARVSQVLDNLLSNAVKYTPDSGQIKVTATAKDGYSRIEITDTGLGLSAEQQARLFQPFSRIHKPVHSGLTSTGLGLFISKGIVQLHGGKMGVDSRGQGQGSTFWVEIPLAATSA